MSIQAADLIRQREAITGCNECPNQGTNPVTVKGREVSLPYCISPDSCPVEEIHGDVPFIPEGFGVCE